jgi:enediyne biosynthesis protein E4
VIFQLPLYFYSQKFKTMLSLKNIIPFAALLFFSPVLFGQNFTKVDDPNNPINTVNIRGFYRGCAWADIDGDGDLDLSFLGWALRNDGADAFSIITDFGSGPGGGLPDVLGGLSWADHDSDGDLDCLYSFGNNNGNWGGGTIIYDNDGNGGFTQKVIDSNNPLRTWSASLCNFDNDPYLDITGAVAVNFAGLTSSGFFYKGNANNTFTKVDTFEFTQNTAPYTVAYWMDIDQDGDSDLMMASGPGGGPGFDFHYRNMLIETGTAGLQRITNEVFATDLQDGQCYNLIDHDLDGDLDLYLTNYSGAPNRFYENQSGTFVSISNSLVFNSSLLGNCWGDFDNDGDEDVLLTSDNLSQAGYFENNGGVFTKISNPFASPFSGANVSGLTIGDYDSDGDLDFFANGGITGANGPRALFKNELDNENHWVQMDLIGVAPSNRSALGAQVWLLTNIDGQDRWLHREVSAQNTFMGHNALRLHFGLGTDPAIDSVRIHWPSGNVDIHTGITADSIYQITEGNIITQTTSPFITPKKTGNLLISPNPTKDLCSIELPDRQQSDSGQIQILNLTGQLHFTKVEHQSSTVLDFSNWAAGAYNIIWETGKGRYLGKLVVE